MRTGTPESLQLGLFQTQGEASEALKYASLNFGALNGGGFDGSSGGIRGAQHHVHGLGIGLARDSSFICEMKTPRAEWAGAFFDH